MRSTRIRTGAVAAIAAFSLTLAACGSDDAADTATSSSEQMTDEATSDAPSEAMTEEMTEDMTEAPSEAMTEDMTEGMTEDMTEESTEAMGGAMMEPVGPACDQIPADGDGSSEGMADDPVATAASNNPLLSTLVTAVGEADLVDTLNNAEALTVFAPINSAFEAIPADTLDAVLADQELLTSILTTHVAEGQMDAAALGEAGTVTSLAGGELEFDAEAMTVTSPDGTTANVVCGNVATANATVHLIDAVLMPAS